MNRIHRAIIFAHLLWGVSFCSLAVSATSDAEILAPLPNLDPPASADNQLDPPATYDLDGFEIRPPNGLLKVRQSLPLEVKYCYLPHDGELAWLVRDCGVKDDAGTDLSPLLVVSKWSVNSIEGGNDTIGHVTAQGGKTTYTAPANKPDNATVAVSAEVVTEGRSKTLLVSNITILEDLQTYIGTVSVAVKGDGFSYKAGGEIAFTQVGESSDSYTSSGGWLEVSYKVQDCKPYRGVLPLAGELYLNTPDEGQHQITLGTDEFEVSCHGINLPQTLLPIHPCEPGKGDTKNNELNGTASCDASKYTWRLNRQ